MLRATSIVGALVWIIFVALPAEATQYINLGLHQRVQSSDTIVLARVIDPTRAVLSIERVFKGEPAKQITLVSYVDAFAAPIHRKALVLDARELLFLTKQGDVYAPVQDQYGRLIVEGDRLVDSFKPEPRSLSVTVASIERLVALQMQSARGEMEADRAYVAALGNADTEVQMWAASNAGRIKTPSPALVDAVLAQWPTDVGPVYSAWEAAGLVANTVVAWRIQRVAPRFARILTTSTNGDERAWAAMALGGTGDRNYLSVLRRIAADDPHTQARALAYRGIVYVLGPESLADLRLGAKDAHEQVRAQAVVDAYNMLELGYPEPRWPPPASALVAEVRAFLTEMRSDPARLVRDNARSMLAMIAKHRP